MELNEQTIKAIIEHGKSHQDLLEYNNSIYEILEGDLMQYLGDALSQQLEGDSSIIALQRAAPINILKKMISKLSKIYSKSPERITEDPGDQDIIDSYR